MKRVLTTAALAACTSGWLIGSAAPARQVFLHFFGMETTWK